MPEYPMNPALLEQAAQAEYPHLYNGKFEKSLAKLPNFTIEQAREGVKKMRAEKVEEIARHASAYLTAAKREVTKVEQLEALPIATVAMFTIPPLVRRVPFELCTIGGTDRIWMQAGDGAGYQSALMARYLPAVVIHEPGVDS
ncbi:hypothetical protein [Glutamicibacter sp. NPDC087344]|uniref:hypothetical protein n=1 Tax=Glutamicibacter sp. NPDC087344 TaxID=3363994 RepID=UPI0038220EA4